MCEIWWSCVASGIVRSHCPKRQPIGSHRAKYSRQPEVVADRKAGRYGVIGPVQAGSLCYFNAVNLFDACGHRLCTFPYLDVCVLHLLNRPIPKIPNRKHKIDPECHPNIAENLWCCISFLQCHLIICNAAADGDDERRLAPLFSV
jgi:hypothetical protein